MQSIFDGKLNIEVAVASGIEAVCKRELLRLGYTPGGANLGRIEFEGDFKDVLRANVFCARQTGCVSCLQSSKRKPSTSYSTAYTQCVGKIY